MEKEDKEKVDKFKEEIKKYLEEKGEKKNYSLYLTEKDVGIIRNKLKTPLSNIVDDFLKSLSKGIQKIDEDKKEKKNDTKKE